MVKSLGAILEMGSGFQTCGTRHIRPIHSLAISSINPDRAKYKLILRYVQEYTDQVSVLAATMPERVMLVKTQDLGEPFIQKRIFDFVGVKGSVSGVRLNIGSVVDAQKTDFRF